MESDEKGDVDCFRSTSLMYITTIIVYIRHLIFFFNNLTRCIRNNICISGDIWSQKKTAVIIIHDISVLFLIAYRILAEKGKEAFECQYFFQSFLFSSSEICKNDGFLFSDKIFVIGSVFKPHIPQYSFSSFSFGRLFSSSHSGG